MARLNMILTEQNLTKLRREQTATSDVAVKAALQAHILHGEQWLRQAKREYGSTA
jgi:hypothetical protein